MVVERKRGVARERERERESKRSIQEQERQGGREGGRERERERERNLKPKPFRRNKPCSYVRLIS